MVARLCYVYLTKEKLQNYGQPSKIIVVSVIAAKPGIEYIRNLHPEVEIWVGDIDPILNAQSYIVPGLGDAGDLAFGEKLQH